MGQTNVFKKGLQVDCREPRNLYIGSEPSLPLPCLLCFIIRFLFIIVLIIITETRWGKLAGEAMLTDGREVSICAPLAEMRNTASLDSEGRHGTGDRQSTAVPFGCEREAAIQATE